MRYWRKYAGDRESITFREGMDILFANRRHKNYSWQDAATMFWGRIGTTSTKEAVAAATATILPLLTVKEQAIMTARYGTCLRLLALPKRAYIAVCSLAKL
jgi:AAA+ superfamily predicted ATPase